MFRLSVLVFVSLIFGIAAKPHKPWNKITDQAFQDTLMSVDARGKMSADLMEEVEPPEDMDETQDDIDPRMRIWKSKQEIESRKAEEDLDLPSAADLLKVQSLKAFEIESVYKDPADGDSEWVRAREELQKYLTPLTDEYRLNPQWQPDTEEEVWINPDQLHQYPEEDMDDLFHPDVVQLLQVEARADVEIPSPRKHTEPEEDLDHMHHL